MGKKSKRRGGNKGRIIEEDSNAVREAKIEPRALRHDCDIANPALGEIGESFEVNVYARSDDEFAQPLYRVTVVDTIAIEDQKKREHEACCFIVPRGKECAYLYSSVEGLRQIAASAKCKRLIAVKLDGRGRTELAFDPEIDMSFLQSELEPLVLLLAPTTSEKITFLTTDTGAAPTLLATGKTMSGDTYFVEQYETKDKQIIRRLVFGSNTNVLQTEVEVSKKGAIKNTLVSRYHAAITSGLAAFSKLTKDSNICLIGLGGGALASTLLDLSQHQTKLTVIELDQVIVSVAQDWFGFRTEDTKQILVTDGLTFFDEIHDNYDAIVVDVDAKNPGVGLSCPPVTFLQSDYLCKLARSLKNGGLIVYNLVARDPKALNAAIGPMGSFPTNFADVAVLRPDPDDLNVTVFATRPLP